ncbi:MAG: hypothetical protein JWQ09_4651 [Segetibacter sp.]|nr:hypothetical protein [Segetibacter sp.]
MKCSLKHDIFIAALRVNSTRVRRKNDSNGYIDWPIKKHRTLNAK